MPPRYAYWTILVDGQPTAFRAAESDELLPTLKRLQVKQPGALMKWFERGRLWESRDEAKDKLRDGYTVGPDGALVPPDATAGRGKGWRPGGEHKDPREKYQLAKKAKWQKFKQMVRARPGHGAKDNDGADIPSDAEPLDVLPEDPALDDLAFAGSGFEDVTAQYLGDDDTGSGVRDADDPVAAEARTEVDPPATDWRGRPKPGTAATTDRSQGGSRPGWKPRPEGRAPRPEWQSRPDARGPKPAWRDRPDARGPKPAWRDRPDARGPKPEWRDRPDARGPKPEWRDRPDARGPKPEWRDRPDARGPKPEWKRPGGTSDRPKAAWRDAPGGSRDSRPGGTPRPDSPRGPKTDWKKPGPGRGGGRPYSGPPKRNRS